FKLLRFCQPSCRMVAAGSPGVDPLVAAGVRPMRAKRANFFAPNARMCCKSGPDLARLRSAPSTGGEPVHRPGGAGCPGRSRTPFLSLQNGATCMNHFGKTLLALSVGLLAACDKPAPEAEKSAESAAAPAAA